MKKLLQIIIKSIVIVGIWYVCLRYFANYRIRLFGVEPQFPYYNILIVNQSRENAVWGYFDGTHYLHLAEFGYDSTGPQAFFPVYPLLIRIMHQWTGVTYFASAVGISLIFLVASLTVDYYLFKQKWAIVVTFLLLYPVSFYLGSIYTESLFLFLSFLFFLFVQKKHFWYAALIAGIASGTRLVGVFLTLALIYEYYINEKRHNPIFNVLSLAKMCILAVISVSGLLMYMYFLSVQFHDPIMFLHVQTLFGAERSSDKIILLPQVLYRYLRMILTVDTLSFLYQRIWLELGVFCSACYAIIKNWRKVPLSWSLYLSSSMLLPTLTGNLSSMPRYILVLVPFLIFPYKNSKALTFILLVSCSLLFYLFWQYAGGAFIA